MRCVVSWHMGVVGPLEGLTPVEVARRGRDLMRTGDHATWVVKDLDAHKSYVVDLAAGRIIPPGRPPDDEDDDEPPRRDVPPRDDDEPPF